MEAKRAPAGFHFTRRMRLVCQDMAARLPELRHVDVDRIAFSFAQTRSPSPYGLQAALTPLRFPGGRRHGRVGGRPCAVQPVRDRSGREMLYVLTFYAPRFLNAPLLEKLTTAAHELWHIHPEFNGDLRRFNGRCYAHTGSQKNFDAHAARLAQRYLGERPPEAVIGFLRLTFSQLEARYGAVVGTRIRRPRLVFLDE